MQSGQVTIRGQTLWAGGRWRRHWVGERRGNQLPAGEMIDHQVQKWSIAWILRRSYISQEHLLAWRAWAGGGRCWWVDRGVGELEILFWNSEIVLICLFSSWCRVFRVNYQYPLHTKRSRRNIVFTLFYFFTFLHSSIRDNQPTQRVWSKTRSKRRLFRHM